MKKGLQLLLLLIVFTFTACLSDDDGGIIPMEINVDGSIDILALNSLIGTDATALVSFNGVSAATFTSEAIPGDMLNYKIDNATTNTEVRIIDFRFNQNASTTSDGDWERNLLVSIDTISRPAKASIKVMSDAEVNTGEYKFDIYFKVYTNGASSHIVYRTDPKIKIKSSR